MALRDRWQHIVAQLNAAETSLYRVAVCAVTAGVLFGLAPIGGGISLLATVGGAAALWVAWELRLGQTLLAWLPLRWRTPVLVGLVSFWGMLAAGVSIVSWAQGLDGEGSDRLAFAAFTLVGVLAGPLALIALTISVFAQALGVVPLISHAPEALVIYALVAAVITSAGIQALFWWVASLTHIRWAWGEAVVAFLGVAFSLGIDLHRQLAARRGRAFRRGGK